ncbi:MAG: RecQ family ATP-dependent DNA helicase [Lactobacillaceae bacterium]|jgi:ATP-dependent DNA helicase RecQ|nr:RecQ family ATP-dependent DNA helicase [Lactobacillaceae bacterium]
MQSIDKVLQTQFGFTSFKPGQREILTSLLAGKNMVAMLPTGGGKSLIYQMMGQLRPGLIIIVTPLLSLMQDQVARLNFTGENRVVALNSLLNRESRNLILRQLQQYRFLFVSPETLSQADVQTAIQQVPINLLVIDEAHTLVSWGPDFRPEYLNLNHIYQQLNAPQTLLMTATATPSMLNAMVQHFAFPADNIELYQRSVDRPNIFLHTEQLPNEGAKRARLAELVRQTKGPGIIYFASRKLATSMAEWLAEQTGLRVAAYHAGLDSNDRQRIQQQFMFGKLDIITATSAFGMGIDKDDVRFVIHYHLSNSLADYLQEIGRAGRDGQPALATLLYAPGDEQVQYLMIHGTIPNEAAIRGVYANQLTAEDVGSNQFNVLDFYRTHQYSLEQSLEIFAQREIAREQALMQMIKYAQATGALRAQLLAAFADATSFDGTYEAVGSVNLDLAKLGLQQPADFSAKQLKIPKWQAQIDELFNLR